MKSALHSKASALTLVVDCWLSVRSKRPAGHADVRTWGVQRRGEKMK
jgi:hypothetical protein